MLKEKADKKLIFIDFRSSRMTYIANQIHCQSGNIATHIIKRVWAINSCSDSLLFMQ